jgi:hypothetical protein
LKLGSFIDTELREAVRGRFAEQGVTFDVMMYPGGMNINNRHYPSGSVVKIVATSLVEQSQVTFVAGFDGRAWSAMSIAITPSSTKR